MMKEVNPFYEGVTRQATLPHRTGLDYYLMGQNDRLWSEGLFSTHQWFQSPGHVLVVLSFTRPRPVGDT